MKKISLLFAFIGMITFTANAQEPVKGVKQTKEPVKVAPLEKPMTAEKVDAPRTNPEPTTATTPLPTTKPVMYPKKRIMNPTKARATATPVVKAGDAK